MAGNDARPPLYESPATRDRFDAAARRAQQHFWDAQAADWNAERAGNGLQPHHVEAMAPWLAAPILLIGAGRGLVLQGLRAAGYAATGVDWSAGMVAQAQRAGVAGLSHGDACHLADRDRSLASVIFSTGVLLPTHGEARRNAYLGEAWRVLVPGGRLILCLWFEQESAAARLAAESVKLPIHTLQAQVHWTLDPLAASLSACGFHTLDQAMHDDVLVWSLAKPEREP